MRGSQKLKLSNWQTSLLLLSQAQFPATLSLSLSITLLFSVSLCSPFTWSLAQLIQFVTQATYFAFFGRIRNICNNQCCGAQWEKCHLHRVNFFELKKIYWLITLLTQINIFLSCSTRLLSTIDRKQILVASCRLCLLAHRASTGCRQAINRYVGQRLSCNILAQLIAPVYPFIPLMLRPCTSLALCVRLTIWCTQSTHKPSYLLRSAF